MISENPHIYQSPFSSKYLRQKRSCSLLDESETSSHKTEKKLARLTLFMMASVTRSSNNSEDYSELFWRYRFPYCCKFLNDLPDLYCLDVLQSLKV